MSESLSLLSDGSRGGGVGGGERGGVVDIVEPEEFWSTELVPLSVVDFVSYSGLLWICIVDGPLEICELRSDSLIYSKAVCGRGGAPSCVGKSKWILRKDGAV